MFWLLLQDVHNVSSTQLFVWIKRHDYSIHTYFILQVLRTFTERAYLCWKCANYQWQEHKLAQNVTHK